MKSTVKKIIYISLLTIFVFLGMDTNSQILITRNDSVIISQDSAIKLILPDYRGVLTWQKSIDGYNWIDVIGTSDSLIVVASEEATYRAKIVEGNCEPVYSDTVIIKSIRSEITSIVDTLFPSELGLYVNNEIAENIAQPGYETFLEDSYLELRSFKDTIEKYYSIEEFNQELLNIQALLDNDEDSPLNTNGDILNSSQSIGCSIINLGLGYAKGASVHAGVTGGVGYLAYLGLGAQQGGGVDIVYDFVNQTRQVYLYKMCSVKGDVGLGLGGGLEGNLGLSGYSKWLFNIPLYQFNAMNRFEGSSKSLKLGVSTEIAASIKLAGSASFGVSRGIIGDCNDVYNLFECPAYMNQTYKQDGVISFIFNSGASMGTGLQAKLVSFIAAEKGISCSTGISESFQDYKTNTNRFFAGLKMSQEILASSAISGLNVSQSNFDLTAAALSILYGTFDISDCPQLTFANVNTGNSFNISSTSGEVDGNISDDGGATIIERGFYLSSTNSNPFQEDRKIVVNGTTGNFSALLEGLIPNTTYYYRAYATNKVGTASGDVRSFITSNNITMPIISTNSITSITQTTASGGGNVTSDGGSTVTARGICWNTTGNPTTGNNKTTDGSGSGSFTSSITGLTPGTPYYVRAYATNNQGTAYGNQVTFTTSSGLETGTVADVDGNVYQTVKIGNQWWMAENLKSTKYNDGTSIPNVTDNSTWAGMTSGAYSWYNNDIGNKNTYGALYNWYAVSTQKLCPSGWHVPSDNEWTTLATTCDGRNSAGNKLKEAGTAHWLSPNTGATNETGFTALPGGYRRGDGPFGYEAHYGTLGTGGHWWSSTEVGPGSTDSWGEFMYYDNGTFPNYGHRKVAGFSVRCIKDDQPALPDISVSAPVSGSIQAGTSKQIQVTVSQSGGNLTNGSYVEAHLYLSTTSTLGADKVQLWVSNNSNPDFPNSVLNTNGSKTVTATVTIPSGTAAGNYYIIAIADEVNYHPESNENNNTQSNLVTVEAQPANQTGTFTDSRDGHVYNWVKIGDQTWMAENLAYLPYINYVSSGSRTESFYYIYDYFGSDIINAKLSINYLNYGVLYNWSAAIHSCPEGWHLPSDSEWKQLELALGMTQDQIELSGSRGTDQGKLLKNTSGWINNGNGTNSFGFNGLPAGRRDMFNVFNNLGGYAYWWTNSMPDSAPIYRGLLAGSIKINRGTYSREFGFSVRCIKD